MITTINIILAMMVRSLTKYIFPPNTQPGLGGLRSSVLFCCQQLTRTSQSLHSEDKLTGWRKRTGGCVGTELGKFSSPPLLPRLELKFCWH